MSHSNIIEIIDHIIPISSVEKQTIEFLNECSWQLEIDDDLVEIPKTVELFVRSRAFIIQDLEDKGFGNHYEAWVLVGKDETSKHFSAKYLSLKMYFNLDGLFITEDRIALPKKK